MPVRKIKKQIFDFSLLRKVFRFAAPYKSKFYISLLLSVALSVISPLRPFLIQITVNRFIKDHNMHWLVLITIIQIGILLVETLLRFYFGFITS